MSFILACVLCVAAIPVSAFADTVSADDLFGVIVDADGNVVEYLLMPRVDVYVNDVYTIPSGGYIRTYQYTTTQDFLFGFATTDVDRQTHITEPYRDFELWIEISNNLGNSRATLSQYPYEISIGGPGYTVPGGSTMCLTTDTNAKYCNGKLVNKSADSATVRLIVIRNFDYDDIPNLW